MTQPAIRNCRDLVELLYGARAATSIRETQFVPVSAVVLVVLDDDPRRIRYEINLINPDVVTHRIQMGLPGTDVTVGGQLFQLPPNSTTMFVRDFLTDLDSVTRGLICEVGTTSIFMSVRETFLEN